MVRHAGGAQRVFGQRHGKGSEPLAQAYAGHQFGGFSPQLGDGRALLLGEVVDQLGTRRDIQLKGSGRTPFSRGGDGKSALGPVLREYIVSEAMHALGVPTTRALAAVTTGENVLRQEGHMAAACLRGWPPVISGSVRFNISMRVTMPMRCANWRTTPLLALPGCGRVGGTLIWPCLEHVIEAQAKLIPQWDGARIHPTA